MRRSMLIAGVVLLACSPAAAEVRSGDQVVVIHDAGEGLAIAVNEIDGMHYLMVMDEPSVIFSRPSGDPPFSTSTAMGPGAGKISFVVQSSGECSSTCTTKNGVPDFDTGKCVGSISACEECQVTCPATATGVIYIGGN